MCAGDETQQTREYQDFLLQLGELQKGYSGANLVVAHPDEKGAHDDYPDSWALAVYGCGSRGEVDHTETKKNSFTERTSAERAKEKIRNRVTARRRR